MCLNVIGEGPSGVIYKGSYRGSVVAVKKMKMMVASKPAAREHIEMELEVEATRMGSLRHPNTVLFMGACLQGDSFCIVSEYCTRGSLFNVLHSPRSNGSSSASSASSAAAAATGSGKQRSAHGSDPMSRSNTVASASEIPGSGKRKLNLKWSLRLRLALGAARGLLYLHSADPPLVHGQLKRYVRNSTGRCVVRCWSH